MNEWNNTKPPAKVIERENPQSHSWVHCVGDAGVPKTWHAFANVNKGKRPRETFTLFVGIQILQW